MNRIIVALFLALWFAQDLWPIVLYGWAIRWLSRTAKDCKQHPLVRAKWERRAEAWLDFFTKKLGPDISAVWRSIRKYLRHSGRPQSWWDMLEQEFRKD